MSNTTGPIKEINVSTRDEVPTCTQNTFLLSLIFLPVEVKRLRQNYTLFSKTEKRGRLSINWKENCYALEA